MRLKPPLRAKKTPVANIIPHKILLKSFLQNVIKAAFVCVIFPLHNTAGIADKANIKLKGLNFWPKPFLIEYIGPPTKFPSFFSR